MNWGYRSSIANDHRITEICLHKLNQCLRESLGVAFISLQTQRYGSRLIPNKIEKQEFEEIVKALQYLGDPVDIFQSPFWILDETSEPQVYRLQPISSIPCCEDYIQTEEQKIRIKHDKGYRNQRESARKLSALRLNTLSSILKIHHSNLRVTFQMILIQFATKSFLS
jgi:hypothetical protein